MKKLSFFLSLFGISFSVSSQSYEQDVLTFSNFDQGYGSARSMGVSGAFGSVGADPSLFVLNPAGIGIYRSSDLSVSAGLFQQNSKANFLSTRTNENTLKFNFAHASAVFTKLFNKKSNSKFSFRNSSSGLSSFSVGIGYNRLADYASKVSYDGFNTQNTLMQSFTETANSLNGDPVSIQNSGPLVYLADSIQMFYFDTATHSYTSYVRPGLQQTGSIETGGSASEVNLVMGGNVSDKFYFGAGLGLRLLNYNRDQFFRETDVNDSIPFFNQYTTSQFYDARGTGFVFRVGFIGRPLSWWRIGASFQSPCWMNITENYTAGIQEDYTGYPSNIEISAAPFRYKITAPLKGLISSSFYLKKLGFISVDYEIQDFRMMKLNFNGFDQQENQINSGIKNANNIRHNIRVGGEFALSVVRFRGGYQISFNESFKQKLQHGFSAGLGIRTKKFYVDFGWNGVPAQTEYTAYMLNDGSQPLMQNHSFSNRFMLTIGWKIGGTDN